MRNDTIPHKVLVNGGRRAGAPAYFVRGEAGWEATSWSDYAGEVRRVAAALVAAGVGKGVPVAILGANRPEWVTFDVAAMAIGAVPAGIYATSSPAECEYILTHSEAPVLLVENALQWEKIATIRPRLPALRRVVVMEGAIDDPMVSGWAEFAASGAGHESEVDDRLGALEGPDLATFIYTSGTTGPPKAVMLTHDNLSFTAGAAVPLLRAGAGDTVLSYLPLSHIAEQMFTIHGAATAGYAVYYSRGVERLLEDLTEVRPTLFFGVPRVWEKFRAGVAGKLAEATGAKAKVAARAMAVGRQVAALRNRGAAVPFPLAAQEKVFDRLVYHKVKAALGLDQVRLASSGAAPVTAEVLEFFAGIGLPVYEVYGQSEDSGPTTFNVPGRARFGSVGPAFPGVEVKIAGDGEVLVRGRNVFAGYYKEPESTAEALRDGWLHSGDLGEVDSGGLFTITGRKKDIIITAGGKNVAPKLIEAGLRNHPLVAEAVLIGDRRPYLTALVTLDAEACARFLAERGLAQPAEGSTEVRADIQRAVDSVNNDLARVEQVKKFTVLPRDLSISGGELTPTLKVKRNVVVDHFSAEIEAMYRD